MIRYTQVCVGFFCFLLIAPVSLLGQNQGSLRGLVIDRDSGEPLMGANVLVLGAAKGAMTDTEGNFTITHLEPGTFSVRITYLGYKNKYIQNIILNRREETELHVELEPDVISLKEIVVTPSQFTIMGETAPSHQNLTHEDIQTMAWGEDTYRAMARLPGISSGDFSAKFTVRGGEHEQVLVLLDGLELYEPFHLKDIEGGILSIIDVETIEGIDLMTGGFTTEYGDRMSGVFNMKLRSPPQGNKRTSLGISLMNARAMSEGTFNNDRGTWLLSARRGYLDIVLDLMGEENSPSPTYYDMLGKVEYHVNNIHTLSANVLHAGDKLRFTEDDDDENDTRYDNTYGWLKLRTIPNRNLFIQTVASFCRQSNGRKAISYREDRSRLDFTVSDERYFDIFGLKQDWNMNLSPGLALKWGVDLKGLKSNYDYRSVRYFYQDAETDSEDVNRVDIEPSGHIVRAYVAPRVRILSPLTVELGLRYDRTSYTDDDLFSPRFNAVCALGDGTFLRGSWGYYYQSQGIHQIRVEHRENSFFPASLARQWVTGIEHFFENGLHLRLEGYYKRLFDLPDDYRNWSNDIEIFPEMQWDRFRLDMAGSTSKGIEAYIKYDQGGKWTWWASYALAKVTDDIRSMVYQGVEYTDKAGEYPGKYDQRQTIYVDANFRPNRNWHLNFSWQYHSGWPYSERVVKSQQEHDGSTSYYYTYDEYFGARYAAYHRLDLKINRHFYTSKGRISTFLTLINLYDHGNVRSMEYNWVGSQSQGYYLIEEPEYWFRLLPSIGISWTWDH
jgi:outer membrane cobalamin receptor